jgi:phage tail sheath protein FI
MDEGGMVTEEVDGDTTEYAVDAIPTNPPQVEEIATAKLRRFLVGFQGGFDGRAPTHPIYLGKDINESNVQGLDCSKRFSSGTKGYIRAFAALSNQDEFDINLIVTPGLSLDLHRTVINRGVDLCESREDCFYILDCVSAHNQPGRVDDAVQQVSTIDSNYAATYYPWVKIIDPATNVLQPYPPSSLMMSVYAANDKTAAEWFAPAGLNRGGIEAAVTVMDRLNFAERDTLYEGKVNPIAAFPGQGIVAFGQKTLQRRASALDRVNVRRLLINLKKFIASSARFLLFEQNVAATRNKFLNIVNPFLENVQQRHGLYAFRVIMDESNNTPDLIDRNILYGQIFLQPARAVEFVILDFNLTPTGASFEA